ncbi:LysR family transcriptional regulator [Pseudomonas sp. RC10]|uniref:LysR family transcriptional regulator n=1 Tax=Pseudomonas bambusae TaxID=3139142 RepID=UPI0031386C4F
MNKVSRLGVRQLRIFAALLKTRNLSAVADQMGLTQQAVSANLTTLREVFSDPLFARTGRGVMPTALALELRGEVDDILAALERLVERAPFDPAQVVGTLNVSASDYAHQVVIAPKLAQIRQQAPGLKLILSEMLVDAVANKMASGEIDLVISLNDYVPAHFSRQTLFDEHYVCVAGAGSPLAKGRISLSTLARQPHVVVSPARANLIGSADGWFQARGLTREVILSVPHFLLVPSMVSTANAVAFLPSRLLPSPGLVALRLEDDACPPGYQLIAAWHPRSNSNPLINWLVGLLSS